MTTQNNKKTNVDNNIDDQDPEKRYYVRNKDLMEELHKWRDSAENPEDRIISESLGLMMYTIAKKLTNHYNFRRYPKEMKEDMISFGCYKAIIGLKNYNFAYNNPFAYFTKTFWNANVAICAKYYKHKNGMKKFVIDVVNEVSNSPFGAAKSTYLNQIQKTLTDFLAEFEEPPTSGKEDTPNKDIDDDLIKD